MENYELSAKIIFNIGPLAITETIITSWVIIFIFGFITWLAKSYLYIKPNGVQVVFEGIVSAIESSIYAVAPKHTQQLLPFIGTLWLFLIIANLSGLIPNVHSPTRDLSATAALAFLVFLSTHWFGVTQLGLKNYLRHYLSPSPILLPFNLISEITRTVALAVRLFGNIMSLEMAALLILLVAGFLVPIPILMLHIIEALVQAYIFGMLALIYIASGLESIQLRQLQKEE
jgi:F-type H+-transporting ATPase subunit a